MTIRSDGTTFNDLPALTMMSSIRSTSPMLLPHEKASSYQASISALQRHRTLLSHELELSQGRVKAQSIQINGLERQVHDAQAQVARLHSQLLMANQVVNENFQSSEYHKSRSYQLSSELAASEERNLGQLKEIMMLKEQLYITREAQQEPSEASRPIVSLDQTRPAAEQVATHPSNSPPSDNQWTKLSKWAEKKLPSVSIRTAKTFKSAIEESSLQLKNTQESQGPLAAQLSSCLTLYSSKSNQELGSACEERDQCTRRGDTATDIQITPQPQVCFVHTVSIIFEYFIKGGGQAASICQAFKASNTNHQSIGRQICRWNTYKVIQDAKEREQFSNAASHPY